MQSKINRCINIDWLEVYCLEPVGSPCDADFYKSIGYEVQPRAYGTPQYKEMLLLLQGGQPVFEVRRLPYSMKSQGGIFDPRSCHIRLSNRTCYNKNPIQQLREFIAQCGMEFKNVSRLDVCLDVVSFDDGQLPADFVASYMRGEYFKVHLCNISGYGEEATGSNLSFHGHDSQFARVYNSIKWGSPSSTISVKLYNKTKEMSDEKDKSYIREFWQMAGLITDKDNVIMADIRDHRYNIRAIDKRLAQGCKNPQEQRTIRNRLATELEQLKKQVKQIWRAEISLKSEFKGIVAGGDMDKDGKGKKRIYELSLQAIDNRDKLLYLFHVVANRYFWFKVPSLTRDGKPQRKDRCKDYWPIQSSTLEFAFLPMQSPRSNDLSRTTKILINALRDMLASDYWKFDLSEQARQGVVEMLKFFARTYKLQELEKAIKNLILTSSRQDYYTQAEMERLLYLRKLLDDVVESTSL